MKAKNLVILLLALAMLLGGILWYLNGQKAGDDTTATRPQTPPAEQPAKPEPEEPTITSMMLTGTWAPKTSNCETDDIWQYRADGTMATFGADGTWSIDGETLTETVTRHMYENPDGAEVWQELETPEVYSSTVSIDGTGQMSKRIGEEELILIKCA
ncbi:hypothetical protein [Sphingorhabdus sp. Alg239-R122]|uniref:hypothetical protein n=1 Tax=Sphingorhabdus sp. Alg239-R122 TaxID=2305989 RepID=UPI0013DCB985|nr:hypothetical protein [Sphingorhabdus sp. Alg239-R122]